MRLTETMVFYIVVGTAVAVSVYLRSQNGKRGELTFQLSTAILFWPLYLPLLLADRAPECPPSTQPAGGDDDMARAIAQVDAELDAALSSLDSWAEDVLARETDRIQELRSAWNTQAARIREMDRLLTQPELVDPGFNAPVVVHSSPPTQHSPDLIERRRQSEQARQKNIDRLRQVRQQAHDDLMGTLAWVRELVSMIHLAKFTGAPASRAEELVSQIAAAVEGVSAVTWQEEARV